MGHSSHSSGIMSHVASSIKATFSGNAGQVATRIGAIAAVGASPALASFGYVGGLEKGGWKEGAAAGGQIATDPYGSVVGSPQRRGEILAGAATSAAVGAGAGLIAGGLGAPSVLAGASWSAGGAGTDVVATGAPLGAWTAGSVLAGGAIAGSVEASGAAKKQWTPSMPGTPNMPAEPSQATNPAPSVGGYNMQLAQQMAMSAGGTLFNTPSQWWASQVNNRGNASDLVGA